MKYNEERMGLRDIIPEIIMDNPDTFSHFLRSITQKGDNVALFTPTPARSGLIFYICDKYHLLIHNSFFPYKDYYYEAKKHYELLPKEERELYEQAHGLDVMRFQAETLKASCAAFLNYLNNGLS